jgi:hypothetical protein
MQDDRQAPGHRHDCLRHASSTSDGKPPHLSGELRFDIRSMIPAASTRLLTCTGLKSPTRIICAIPQASLRSVLLICAESAAFMCRVSTQITG